MADIFIDNDRRVISLTDLGDSVGNSVEASANGSEIYLEIDNPWAGDTESGFGRNCSISIPADAAYSFGKWLLDMTETGAD